MYHLDWLIAFSYRNITTNVEMSVSLMCCVLEKCHSVVLDKGSIHTGSVEFNKNKHSYANTTYLLRYGMLDCCTVFFSFFPLSQKSSVVKWPVNVCELRCTN